MKLKYGRNPSTSGELFNEWEGDHERKGGASPALLDIMIA